MRERPYRRGGRLTEIGFGGAQVGNLYRAISDDDALAAIDAAWSDGIRYFDTAPHYGLGLSERRLGQALAGRPRDELVISTKAGRLLVPSPETADRPDDDGFAVPADHRRVFDFSRDGILRSVESSLERLGVDRLDIVYLHDPDRHWEAASTSGVGALAELREQGVVGAIGAGMNQSAMLTEFVRRCDVDIVMVAGRYTLLDQSAGADLLPAAAERGVSVVVAGVYNSGILSRASVPEAAHYDYSAAPPEILARARRIAEVCARFDVDLPTAAVQFALRRPEVVSVVLGTGTAAHVRSGAERGAADVPAELWEELADAGLIDPAR
ncbi:aldo/keto reductase [Leifsonia shinshuensis]|uniref:D-threo-aldose 1-dehydrogenase n=1 Tax=Leifsonia shinshuensis TaxID=150026 RepID=A0A853CQ15_9MICO|nr:aldo/keto reductase [Leifsonia shinshuensis]NYJ22757.1 D-threo-aldose 1-dehydrogenase [Leifsonia shinshuensis]